MESLREGSRRQHAETEVLPPLLRAWLGLIAVLATLVVVAFGVPYAGDGESSRVDRWFVLPTEDSVRQPLRNVALAIDFLGEPAGSALLIVAAVAGCLLLRRPRGAVLVVVGVGAAVVTTTLVKHLVGRTIHGPGNLSYPSGHTTFATALAVAAALVAVGRLGLGRAGGISLVLGAALVGGGAMGWAQVALSAHYPTDVLGGWCTALVVVPASAWVIDRVADTPSRRYPVRRS
ncbi:phosphatase PAP2 family protein [Streptomyces boninensis]|uniref:phosphatase PAP2 family protein n=1 Tax=Streptomyces boninensis TaxID=2039455 RepID=UPI003B213267